MADRIPSSRAPTRTIDLIEPPNLDWFEVDSRKVLSPSADSQNDSPETDLPFRVLDVDSLVAAAIASHPSIIHADAGIADTRGQLLQSGLPFNPVLQYQSDEIGNEDSTGLHSVAVSQQFVTANKLQIAQQVQARDVERLRSDRRRIVLQVATRALPFYVEIENELIRDEQRDGRQYLAWSHRPGTQMLIRSTFSQTSIDRVSSSSPRPMGWRPRRSSR